MVYLHERPSLGSNLSSTHADGEKIMLKDTIAENINPAWNICDWNVNIDTPMYKNTKFSARKFSSSNNYNKEIKQYIIRSEYKDINTGICKQISLTFWSKYIYIQ